MKVFLSSGLTLPRYPKFMDSEKGQTIARLVWDETIALLGELSPEAKGVLSGLAAGEDASN